MAQVAVQSTDRFERKREAILDASTALLNSRGVKGLTLGIAAAAVDLSTTSVTYYFKRKDDLAAAVMLRGVQSLTEIVNLALAQPTPCERLRSLWIHRQRAMLAGPGRVRLAPGALFGAPSPPIEQQHGGGGLAPEPTPS